MVLLVVDKEAAHRRFEEWFESVGMPFVGYMFTRSFTNTEEYADERIQMMWIGFIASRESIGWSDVR